MRELSDRLDVTRKSGNRRVVPRYIFAFEGYNTEYAYFNGVMTHKDIAEISDLISICILQRDEKDAGCSSPSNLLKLVKKHVDAMENGRHNVHTVCEHFQNEIHLITGKKRNDPIVKQYHAEIKKELESLLDEKGFVTDEENANLICKNKAKEIINVTISRDLPDLESYDPENDRVCVIIDRDTEAHSSEEIDGFISECRRFGFEPYICNPCFELWLMLHFDNLLNVDKKELRQNPMIDGKRLTEIMLDSLVKEVNPNYSYSKLNLDPMMFLHRIKNEAIQNSRFHCQDIRCLKHEVGTNLGLLFGDLCGN